MTALFNKKVNKTIFIFLVLQKVEKFVRKSGTYLLKTEREESSDKLLHLTQKNQYFSFKIHLKFIFLQLTARTEKKWKGWHVLLNHENILI